MRRRDFIWVGQFDPLSGVILHEARDLTTELTALAAE